MNRQKTAVIAALVIILATAGTALASGESAQITLPPGTTAINPHTCKFLHKERDPATPGVGGSLGTALIALRDLRVYTLYEDARHDAKMACLTHKIGKPGLGGPGPRGPRGFPGPAGPAGPAGGLAGYVQVTAPINFKQASATVTCPNGDVVLGGGANVEVEGSYPSSDSSWTVTRDHTWGNLKTGTVYATCAIGGTL